MIDFSIVFPTRERIKLFNDLCKSLQGNTEKLERIEVLVAYDIDDLETGLWAGWFSEHYKDINIKIFGIAREFNIHRYYNFLYKFSSGRYLIPVNDDSLFVTRHWDKIALEKISEYLADKKDGVFLGWVDDDLKKRFDGASCFPIIPRVLVDLLGYLQKEQLCFGGADIYIHKLIAMFDRVFKVGIKIDHISHHTGKREKDKLYIYNKNRAKNHPEQKHIRLRVEEKDIEKVRNYISSFASVNQ